MVKSVLYHMLATREGGFGRKCCNRRDGATAQARVAAAPPLVSQSGKCRPRAPRPH